MLIVVLLGTTLPSVAVPIKTHATDERSSLLLFSKIKVLWPERQMTIIMTMTTISMKNNDLFCCPGRGIAQLILGNCNISTSYSIYFESNWYKLWPNTKFFSSVNYSINTLNIHSTIGKIVTDFWWIFQQLNE